ncbi:hypothetical protein Golob_006919, partial [Gossypium lobatum]|nr:hypothetical protein [Gossypium lobatum]MBA0700941.1 hypothetical protein [Gossypium aridum]
VNTAQYDTTTTTKIKSLKKKVHGYKKPSLLLAREKSNMSAEMLNATLVVTVLAITAIYQSSLSPPGGVWQAASTNTSTSDPLFPTSNNVSLHFLEVGGSNKRIVKHHLGEESRKAGTTILDPWAYFLFWFLNSQTFLVSILYTLFILSHVTRFILAPLFFLAASYFLSMTILAPSSILSAVNMFYVILVLSLVTLVDVLRYYKSANFKEWINLRKAVRGGSNVGLAERLRRVLSLC